MCTRLYLEKQLGRELSVVSRFLDKKRVKAPGWLVVASARRVVGFPLLALWTQPRARQGHLRARWRGAEQGADTLPRVYQFRPRSILHYISPFLSFTIVLGKGIVVRVSKQPPTV